MSSGKVAAEYILKNRQNGSLKYAVHVLEAAPYIRKALLDDLLEETVKRLRAPQLLMKGTTVDRHDDDWWFSINVRRQKWGSFCISVANWKDDASEVAISVCHTAESELANEVQELIHGRLSGFRSAWHRKRWPNYVSNVWAQESNWGDPAFLLRLVDEAERYVVVGEVERDIVDVVKTMNKTLVRCAKGEP